MDISRCLCTACSRRLKPTIKEREVNTFHFIREGQPGSELFTFVIPAQRLMALARVERFNEAQFGVQRKLNYGHVVRMRNFMLTKDATFSEPILGNLEGEWKIDRERGILSSDGNAYISVDDGQQRIAALHLLPEEKLGEWEFKVTATLNLPYDVRVQRFLQQLKRLKIDSQLVLQLQDRTSSFPDAITSRAYLIGKRLATEEDSPLFGLVRLEEKPSLGPIGEDAEKLISLAGGRPITLLRESTIGIINISNLMGDLRRATSSSHSVLLHHDVDAQYKIIVRLLSVAREIWPTAWENPKHYFLRRAEGVRALLQLLVVGQYFKSGLTNWSKTSRKSVSVTSISTTEEKMKEILMTAKHYDWSYQRFRIPNVKFPAPPEIAQQLDSLIFQKEMPRRRAPREEVVNA